MSDTKDGKVVDYVHVHFTEAITPPSSASTHGIERSVFIDAFAGDADGRKRVFVLQKCGDTITARDTRTGVTRDYPWALVRQALRSDDRYVNGDPRQGRK